MSRQPRAPHRAGERGSAMLITMIISLAMASVVMYAVSDTMNANKSAQREDNYARALAAAEYGAELAISEIGKGLKFDGDKDTSLVLGDFVVGENNGAQTLYNDKTNQAWEQRRITGKYDNQDFRVQVRSARQVYNTAISDVGDKLSEYLVDIGWQKAPDNASIPLGEIKAYQFQDIYEITSSAQDARVTTLGPTVSTEFQTRPVIQAVVKFDYESPLDDLLNKLGVIHQEDAAHLQVLPGTNTLIDYDNLEGPKHLYVGTNEFKPGEWASGQPGTIPTKEVYNLAVSGEDHNLTKHFSKSVSQSRILTPLKLETEDPQFFGAIAYWWSAGYTTLNYRHPDNLEPEDNVFNLNDKANGLEKKSANPYRPYSYEIGSSNDNRNMWVVDPSRTYDSYLLGGKINNGHYPWNSNNTSLYNWDTSRATGLTVTVNENVTGTNNIKGQIVETAIHTYKANDRKFKSPSKGGAFKIVLGAYEDLRNLYINIQDWATPTPGLKNVSQNKGGRQIYVGQYTPGNWLFPGNTLTKSVPLFKNITVRPQTIHTIRNADNQILVRLYEREELGKKVYYKYPVQKSNIKTGDIGIESLSRSALARRGGITYPSADALAELDRLISEGRNTNVTAEMIAADKPNLKNTWIKDQNDVWYYGGNYTEYQAFTFRDSVTDANGNTISQGRIYWLRYDPAKKLLYYVDDLGVEKSTSASKASHSNYYFYEIKVVEETRPAPDAAWTGYYVWAHGGFHALNNGSDIKTDEGNYRIVFDGESSKAKSGFVLYGANNPDLDMLVQPDRESDDTDETFAEKKAEYQRKKELYSKRVEGITAMAVGRVFPWQEIIGYSIGKRSGDNDPFKNHPDIICRHDGTTDPHSIYADRRTFFRKENGTRVKVGFDEIYQAINPGTLAWEKHPLAGKYGDELTDISPGYLQDRHDPIRVFNPADTTWDKAALYGYNKPLDSSNPDIRTYNSMDDFLTPIEFGTDANGNLILSDAINILVGYEDNTATEYTDYDYTDLMFTIYVAPKATGEASGVNISQSAVQWWERDEREGLTGLVAHTPVSVNDQASRTVSQETDGDAITPTTLTGNYHRLGYLQGYLETEDMTPEEKAALEAELAELNSKFWSMLDAEGKAFSTFPRAKFEDGATGFPAVVDDPKWREECLKKAISPPPYFFTDDDILNYVQWIMVDIDVLKKFIEKWDRKLPPLFDSETHKPILENIKAKLIADNSSAYELHYIDIRYDEPYRKVKTGMTTATPSSLAVTKDEVLIRRIAAEAIGSETREVLGVKAVEYAPLSNEDGFLTETTSKAFLPGEVRLEMSDPNDHNAGNIAAKEEPYTVRHRQDLMEFTDRGSNDKLRQATVMQFMDDDPAKAVKNMYTDYFANSVYNPGENEVYRTVNSDKRTLAERETLWEKFGMKDKRFVIGQHRGGNNPEFKPEDFLQDRYEVVSLYKPGFNPYKTAGAFLANNLQFGDAETGRYAYELKYGIAPVVVKMTKNSASDAPDKYLGPAEDAAGVPNFVFDKGIDGAGTMVVNGNMIIKDTFAYHGVLVVLGDLIIEPDLKRNQFVWSTDGWPLDRLGHSIRPGEGKRHLSYDIYEDPAFDKEANSWGYTYIRAGKPEFTTKLLDHEGKYIKVTDTGSELVGKDEPVRPLRRNEYRGELILQGQLIVKGRIITKEVTDEATGLVYRGVLNAYWSRDAVEATAGIWAKGENVIQRISWNHNDAINVEPVWNDKLDTPADHGKK